VPRGWTIFLDDGGVLNDNRLRETQWPHLLGEFLPPLLGGTPAAWAEANRVVAGRLLAPDAWRGRMHAAADYAAFERGYVVDWLGGMCTILGIPIPAEAEAVEIGRRASHYVTRRVRAAMPGAIVAVDALHAAGYPLFTAAGTASDDLAGYLDGMGLRVHFRRLYGPDLVGMPKRDAAYYRAIFADAGVDPATALVVDDSPLALGWAAEAHAVTVLVEHPAGSGHPGPLLGLPAPSGDPAIAHRISRLADLPGYLKGLASSRPILFTHGAGESCLLVSSRGNPCRERTAD